MTKAKMTNDSQTPRRSWRSWRFLVRGNRLAFGDEERQNPAEEQARAEAASGGGASDDHEPDDPEAGE